MPSCSTLRVFDDVTGTFQASLAVIAVLGAVAGLVVAFLLYYRRRWADRPVEPVLLLKGWYYDSSIAAFMGGPGRRGFDAVAWFDRHVIDGAVNGVAALVRGTGSGVRRTQSGFVRAYAGIVTGGAVVVVFVLLLRGVVL